jgi:hypothetical protein
MSSYTFSKLNPPPPPPLTSKTLNVSSAEISNLIAPTPSHAFIKGLPVQYYAAQGFLNFSLLEQFTASIDFGIQPFTYLNFSNTTTIPSPYIVVKLKNLPEGTIFMVNGPTSWEGTTGILTLEDRDENGNFLPNYILEINPRGTSGSPSSYVNILVGRDSNGLMARAMN